MEAPISRPPLERPRIAKCWGDVYLLIDEVSGGGEPVVEDILLLLEHALLVPAFAVFAAAAQIGDSEPAALVQPPGVFGIPSRA